MSCALSQSAFGSTACATASAAAVALGASSDRWRPSTVRVWTSSASVSQGRPMQARVTSSTSMRSTLVWSIWTTCNGRSVRRLPLTWRNWLPAAAAPSRALTRSRRLRADTRARSAFIDGTASPAVRQFAFRCRQTTLRVGRSRLRYTSSMAVSTSFSAATLRRRAPRT